MPEPEYRQSTPGNRVVNQWTDQSARTGEGRMYRTADGRVFEGGPCIPPGAITHNVNHCGQVIDRVVARG
jgi:hypothetical protein